uniref:Flavoprotein domain-containing protein n=1 Tax=Asterionellopsis glacialis TaxID=33640 RepID=A0A7S0L099_9STRA
MSNNPIATTARTNLLLGITGSVAAIKGPEIVVKLLSTQQYNIQVLLSEGGHHFWKKAPEYDSTYWSRFQSYMNNDNDDSDDNYLKIHTAQDEWKNWNSMGDSVLHIELRNWADICVIAPLSAHTLAKIANGLCDDTLSCVLRAWNFTTTSPATRIKPLIVAPAMNTAMWDHPITQHQFQTIGNFFTIQPRHMTEDDDMTDIGSSAAGKLFHIIQPQVKTLACGEIGSGALASVEDILTTIDQVRVAQQEYE